MFSYTSSALDRLSSHIIDPTRWNNLPFRGAWWLIGTFVAFRQKGCGFESRTNCHVWTLGKSFTRSCLWRFSVKLRHSIRAMLGAPLSSSGLEEALSKWPEWKNENEWIQINMAELKNPPVLTRPSTSHGSSIPSSTPKSSSSLSKSCPCGWYRIRPRQGLPAAQDFSRSSRGHLVTMPEMTIKHILNPSLQN